MQPLLVLVSIVIGMAYFRSFFVHSKSEYWKTIKSKFAATCSGTGEQIILHGSARLACRLGFECIDDLMNDFISEESIQNDTNKSLGIVRLEKRTDSLLVSFAHTTPSMNIGKVTT